MLGIHHSLSMVAPEFSMGPPEAHEYATAILDVAKHYPVRGLDEKMLAWFNLSQIMIIGYGSRVMMVRARIKRERNNGPRQAPQQPPLRPAAPQNPQAPPASPLQTAAPPSNKGVIAGIGEVELPADHPLNPNRGRLQ